MRTRFAPAPYLRFPTNSNGAHWLPITDGPPDMITDTLAPPSGGYLVTLFSPSAALMPLEIVIPLTDPGTCVREPPDRDITRARVPCQLPHAPRRTPRTKELVEDLEGLSGWRAFIADFTGIELNIEA